MLLFTCSVSLMVVPDDPDVDPCLLGSHLKGDFSKRPPPLISIARFRHTLSHRSVPIDLENNHVLDHN